MTAANNSGTGQRRTPFILHSWLVHPDLNQIEHREHGELRHLEPRLMRLLCILAANPGRLIERDVLFAELWPRVIVNENSLTRAVSDLRKLLRDSEGGGRKLIQTIPKRGYRLQAGVISAGDGPAVAAPVTARRATSAWQWAAGGVIAACLALVIGLGVNSSGRPGSSVEDFRLADELIHQDVGVQGGEVALSALPARAGGVQSFNEPVLSPNGEAYAFIAAEPGAFTIYLGNRDTGMEPVPVYSSQMELVNLAWSPVGHALLFARASGLKPAINLGQDQSGMELLSLDLETGRLSRLIEEQDSKQSEQQSPAANLTAMHFSTLTGLAVTNPAVRSG